MTYPIATLTSKITDAAKRAEIVKTHIRARLAKSKRAVNREAWLTRALDLFRPWFDSVECPVPEKVKVTCGWPSQRGTAMRGRVIGECWSPKVSGKAYTEIFISPRMGDINAKMVLATLLHEVVHAAAGHAAGHGPDFRKPAVALGLEGKMTATIASDRLNARFDALLIGPLGHYPHAKVNATDFERPVGGPKKQGTRMVKCSCEWCGYTLRTTRKWIQIAIPCCPDPKCQGFGQDMAIG